jgi:transposase
MAPITMTHNQIVNKCKGDHELAKWFIFLLETVEQQTRIIEQQNQTIEQQNQTIEQQAIRIQELEIEVKELKRQLNSKSHNSNKPPSSDGFRKPKSERKSGGKIGAPKGHKGDNLHFTSTPDHVKNYRVENRCTGCNRSLEDVQAETKSRQVYDLPKIELAVTEHVAEHKTCPSCGTRNRAEFPAGVHARTQYGPQIKAFAAYMNVQHFIPLERLQQMTEDLFGHEISETTVLNHLETLYHQLEKVEEEIQGDLLGSGCIHADESGVRVAGKLHWVHSVSTAESTLYSVQEKRGSEGINKMGLLPEYQKIVSHDCFSPYFNPEYDFGHALCGAHLIRECQSIVDHDKEAWAKEMKTLLQEICKEGKEAREEGRLVSLEKMKELEQKYDDTIQDGRKETAPLVKEWEQVHVNKKGTQKRGKKAQPKSVNLLDRFTKYKEAILISLHDSRVPFDNNQAERDIRMIKVKQKVSGSFRTLNGANIFARIRGVISTAQKRGMNILSTLGDIARNDFSFRTTSEG